VQLLKSAFVDVLEAGLIGVTVFRAKQRRPAFRFTNLPQNKNTNCYFVGKMLLLATYVDCRNITYSEYKQNNFFYSAKWFGLNCNLY
jgi:hypothetical protein